MRSKTIAVVMMLVVLNTSFSLAQSRPEDAGGAAKLKREVTKAFDKNARITVELRDGRKLQGSVMEIAEHEFVLVSDGSSLRLAYSDLARVKRHGSAARKRALVAAGALAGMFGLAIAAAAGTR